MEPNIIQKEIKVLVASEDHIGAKHLIDFLAEKGVMGRTVLGAAELKEVMFQWRPNFILIDLMYPELNALMFLKTLKQNEKLSEYECGSEPSDSAIRQPFTIHFYIVGILYLIFDVEIRILMPIPSMLFNSFKNIIFLVNNIFLLILLLGIIYEL